MDKEYVIEKLAKKKELDPDLLGFGIARHEYNLLPPIKEEKLVKLEKKFGISLPEDYRHFILNIGDGGAGPSYGLYSLEASITGKKDKTYQHGSSDVRKEISKKFVRPPLDIYSDEEIGDEYYDNEYDGQLMLCQHGCANDDFLVLNGPDKGTVWQLIEWVGHLIPLLKEKPDIMYLNRFTGKEREAEERKWVESLFSAKPEEHMTFTDWYTEWLEKPPHILTNARKRKVKRWFNFFK